jgi:transcriptional regulator with XRE-family HTH domain
MRLNTEAIRKLRKEKGWTQQQLAELADVSLRTIQRIEKSGVTSMETSSALCAVFEVERKFIMIPEVSDSKVSSIQITFIVFLVGLLTGSIMTYSLL